MQIMHNKRFKGAIILVMIMLTAFLFVKTVGEIKAYRFIGGGVPVSNTITVTGEGEAFAVADIAQFSFSVIEEAKTVEEAQSTATTKINIARALLEEAGIEEKDIKTTAYNIYPKYEYIRSICTQFSCPPSKQELQGYEVNQTTSVKVRDTSKAGTILAEIGTIGVSSVSGLNFSIDDEDVIAREARKMAIDEAKSKAKDLAKDLGVRLIRVVNFNESGDQPFYGRVAVMEMAMDSAVGGGIVAPEISVGQNKVTSNVSITYEIR